MDALKNGWLPVLALLLIHSGNGLQAAIPPAESILKKIASRRASTKWIKLTSQVQVALSDEGEPVDSKAGFARFRAQTLWDQTGRKLKVRIQDEGGAELFAGERTLSEEPAGSQGQTFGRLVFESSGPELQQRFKAFEIPVYTSDELLSQYQTEPERRDAEASTLKRLEGKVAWVIGKANGPRAWIEKDSHFPMLFEVPGAGGLTRYFRLRNARLLQDHPFPMGWVLSVGKPDQRQGQAEKILIKEDITEALSVNEVLVAQFGKSAKWSGYTPTGEALSPEMRTTVEKYLAHYR